jgi:hypothetical protein
MKYDLHEQILIYLFDLRENGIKHDLLDKFDNVRKTHLYETVISLNEKKYIETDRPFKTRLLTNGRDKQLRQEGEKLISKITPDGIDYVKTKILVKRDRLAMWNNIFGIAGVVIASILGTVTFVREDKYKTESRQNQEITIKLDSVNALRTTDKNYYDSLLKVRDQNITELTDSLKKDIKIKK